MTKEELLKKIDFEKSWLYECGIFGSDVDIAFHAIKNSAIEALEQEHCEMTAEDYRQRMMQAFHNADCDELIAVCVLPTEKEFEHLEWLLKNHYKKEPCEDAISRQATLKPYEGLNDEDTICVWLIRKNIEQQPSVNPTGHWIPVSERLPEDNELVLFSTKTDRVFEGRFFSDNTDRQWYSFCDKTFSWNNVVLAWMPLLEPYKAESEE